MMRRIVAASLLLGALGGCSRSTPQASSPDPKAVVPPQAAVNQTPPPPPVSSVVSPAPAPAASPAAKPVAHKAAKSAAPAESPTDQLAKCLTEKGAAMYGVFWCDHCREQKELFGDSFQYVHYVECVTPDAPRTITPECKAQGIKNTPTWIFPDGSRVEGSQPLATLAQRTGCKAP